MRIARVRIWIGVVSALLAAHGGAPLSAQFAAPPDRDNTLFEEATQQLGCFASTSNGAGQYLLAGFTNTGLERRALLRFDMSSIPPGSTITAVTVTLNLNRVAGGSSPSDQFGLRRLTADWGEGTSDGGSAEGGGAPATANDATWCERFYQVAEWASLGGDFASPASATIAVGTAAPALHVWGSTAALVADVQGWVDAPQSNFGWILIQDLLPPPLGSPGQGSPLGAVATARRFDSREGAAAVRPRLEVTFAPPSVVEVPSLSPWGLALLAGLLLAGAIRTLRALASAG